MMKRPKNHMMFSGFFSRNDKIFLNERVRDPGNVKLRNLYDDDSNKVLNKVYVIIKAYVLNKVYMLNKVCA